MTNLRSLGVLAFTAALSAQTSVSLRLNGDDTPSGFGGRPPRLIEAGTFADLTVVGPAGALAWVLAGTRLEPGVPFLNSPNPVHINNIFDVTPLATGAPGPATLAASHIVGAPGRVDGAIPISASLAGLRIALQGFVAVPGTQISYLLTNPVEFAVPLGPVGPPASVQVVLSAPTVIEADNGGTLTVSAIARDAAGRTIRPTPAIQMTTNGTGATFPAPDRIAFPRQGAFTVTVTVTGTAISHTVPVRVVPELEPDQFPLYHRHMRGLDRIAADGLRALALGDRSGVNAAVAALTSGIQPSAVPAVVGRAVRMPVLGSYPTLQQLIAHGGFPANPDDPRLLPDLTAIRASLQGIQTLLAGTPGPLPPNQLALLASRANELESLVTTMSRRSFSAREIYAQIGTIETTLNQLAPAVMQRTAEFILESLRQPPGGPLGVALTITYAQAVRRLVGDIYGPFLDYIGGMLATIELANLINNTLRQVGTLNLCDICSSSCAVLCSGVTFNCNFDFYGTGLQGPPSNYRILVLRVTSRLSEVVNALNAHDSVSDYFQALERLGIDIPAQFFAFTPTASGTTSLFNCGPLPYLELNPWPLQRQGLPAPLVILVLRLDAVSGLSNAIVRTQF